MSRVPFKIVPISDIEPSRTLEVINAAFGRAESSDWYDWKHREGPWGASIGAAAVDHSGLIGVRLLLPWMFLSGERRILAHRATEAATLPRAQGRGVFSALNRWMMEEVETALIFSTPNEQSRAGYIKLGWQRIAEVRYRWELPGMKLSAKYETGPTSDSWLHTAWSEEAIRWRTDPRCRHRYVHTRASCGGILHYRVLNWRGVRGVAPLDQGHSTGNLHSAWKEMLQRSRARFVLRPDTQGTPVTPSRLGVHRGSSLILGWLPPRSELGPVEGGALARVPWTSADLEAVI